MQRTLMALFALCLVLAVGSAQAIIVNAEPTTSSNPATYQTAPTVLANPLGDPGWDNVGWGGTGTGTSDYGTAVYLGDGWAITANHTYAAGITLNGIRYHATEAHRLTNPDNSTNTDLRLFKLDADPGLAALTISSSTATAGDTTMLIGTGLERGSSLQTYQTSPGHTIDAYIYAATRAKTWGNNAVTNSIGYTTAYSPSSTFGRSFAFRMDFDQITGEAVAGDKDSGSAVFVYNTLAGQWELGGITIAVENLFQTNPGDVIAQFGNTDVDASATIAIDLSVYRDQIYSFIPEPGSLLLLGPGGLMLLRRRRGSWVAD